jgi:hypothetical protein
LRRPLKLLGKGSDPRRGITWLADIFKMGSLTTLVRGNDESHVAILACLKRLEHET